MDTSIRNIHEQDKVLWSNQAHESVDGRAKLIKEMYEKVAGKALEIVDNPNTSPKELEIASRLLIGSHINILNMLREGPAAFRSNIIKAKAKELEDKDEL